MRDIFVSRPSTRNEDQKAFLDRLDELLRQRDLRPRSLGQTDYPNKAPIQAVLELMDECEGALILGLEQLHVKAGIDKPGSDEETVVKDLHLPTPWNHIEAGMAFKFQLPILIIREKGVEGGVFGIGSSDRYIHQATLSEEWLQSPEFTQPFNSWHEEMIQQS